MGETFRQQRRIRSMVLCTLHRDVGVIVFGSGSDDEVEWDNLA